MTLSMERTFGDEHSEHNDTSPHTHSRRQATHLPPAITIQVILLNDLYPVPNLEFNFVRNLWSKVVERVDIFWHLEVGEQMT